MLVAFGGNDPFYASAMATAEYIATKEEDMKLYQAGIPGTGDWPDAAVEGGANDILSSFAAEYFTTRLGERLNFGCRTLVPFKGAGFLRIFLPELTHANSAIKSLNTFPLRMPHMWS